MLLYRFIDFVYTGLNGYNEKDNDYETVNTRDRDTNSVQLVNQVF